MSKLSSHSAANIIKALVIGESGTGKTGALASLARAGYNLRIADMDNGTDILYNILLNQRSPQYDPAAAERIDVIKFNDPFLASGGGLTPQDATAWSGLINSLNKWEDKNGLKSLGPNDIFVVDSLTFAGKAALRYIQKLNNRLTTAPQIQDYLDAQRLVENLCSTLYGSTIPCNIICLSHIRKLGEKTQFRDAKDRVQSVEDMSDAEGFPETGTGRALSSTIGRHFNMVLQSDLFGSGAGVQRIIRTVPAIKIGLKTTAPGILQPQYPIDTGLRDIFSTITGRVNVGKS